MTMFLQENKKDAQWKSDNIRSYKLGVLYNDKIFNRKTAAQPKINRTWLRQEGTWRDLPSLVRVEQRLGKHARLVI